MNDNFSRIDKLPVYVFSVISELRTQKRKEGADVIDFSMGNPDGKTPQHIVDKMIEATLDPNTHRYSVSKGIPKLRTAIANWYKQRFDVSINPDTEAIVTIGSKEGIAHLMSATMSSGDVAIVPSPSYPIHTYGCIIADAEVKYVPVVENQNDFLESIREAVVNTHPKPKMIIMNFPCNPTAQCVTLEFWEKLVEIALEHKIYILQDLAYADITFDNYITPSILQVKNAKKVAVEFFSLSKSYNMPGWRIGFCCGNKKLVSALARFKSYHDYGTFAPLQIAAIEALEGDQQCARDICAIYKSRRDILCDRLNSIGWLVEKPKATMFVWAKIPKKFSHLNSLEFCKFVINEAHVVLSPGSGFGPYGEGYVRFALIENEERIRQAIRNIKKIL